MKIFALFSLLSLFVINIWANTGSATLDRIRAYVTDSHTFSEDLSTQGAYDGGFSLDASKSVVSTSFGTTVYMAVAREAAGTDLTHVYLFRNRGTAVEGWDNDTNQWTTSYGNVDPIDSVISQGFNADHPAITVDSKGVVYIAYTRSLGNDRKVFLSKYDPQHNDIFIWDDGETRWSANIAEVDRMRDSISNNSSYSTTDAHNVAPAIAVDNNDDVYIAYSQEMSSLSDAKIFLSKYDTSEQDVFIWDANGSSSFDDGSFTNDLRAPANELDSASVNVANFQTSTSPVMAIDSNNVVYFAYLQEGIAGNNNRIWLSKYDPAADDLFIWHANLNGPEDGGFTNDQRSMTDELDSFGNNSHSANEAIGSPAIAIDSNNNVFVAYLQKEVSDTHYKVWLSTYNAALDDTFIWHANLGGAGVGGFTNDQTSATSGLDSAGINAVADTNAIGDPNILIDKDDRVWISFVQETSAGADPHVFLAKFDPNVTSGIANPTIPGDVLVWNDATSSFTSDQPAPGAQSGISWNNSADNDAIGTPSMALADNGDIYIAYANEAAASNHSHINLSKLSLAQNDVFVWHAGLDTWTNDLTSPSLFSDALDMATSDDQSSHSPVLQATPNGIYLSYLYKADTVNENTFLLRIGSGDSDHDGVIDPQDVFPFDASETLDNDNDGTGNNSDTDDDNDGVADADDAFPLDAQEQLDTDQDGIGNNADLDDDNDGVADAEDLYPLDPTKSSDKSSGGSGGSLDFLTILMLFMFSLIKVYKRKFY